MEKLVFDKVIVKMFCILYAVCYFICWNKMVIQISILIRLYIAKSLIFANISCFLTSGGYILIWFDVVRYIDWTASVPLYGVTWRNGQGNC